MASSRSEMCTRFLEAAGYGDLRLLKKLAAKLRDGCEGSFDKIRDIKGCTALHIAAGTGNTRICKYLMNQLKLDVNAQDEDDETPLLYATQWEHLETALYLIDNGADLAKANNTGHTPLHFAAIIGCADFLQQLISRGADLEAKSDMGTPLVYATYEGNREAVEVLLQNKANPNVVTNNMTTPIMLRFSSLEITHHLVKAGADVNINLGGTTPLNFAVARNKVEILVYLLKAGANPNVLDFNGLTPLEKAAFLGYLEVTTVLFPVTSPIPHIPDWSVSGLLRYVNSREAQEKLALIKKQLPPMGKSKGDDAFKKKDYFDAIAWYSAAIEANPYDAKVLSNRSLCYALVKFENEALADAKACARLRPDWPKAHYRKGVAWKLLKNYDKAAKSFSRALNLDPNNQEIQKAMREVVEAQIAATRI